MSLSRSPSPRAEGGWASPGLSSDFGSTGGTFSPRKAYLDLSVNGGASGSGTVTWANARAKTDEVNGYPSFSTRKTGFFSRHARRISSSLPQFNLGLKKDYSEREKLGRGRPYPYSGSWSDRMRTFIGSMGRRMRMRGLLVMVLILSIILFYTTPLHYWYRRAFFLGGGSKFVIVLAANIGGGVMDWKGPREWAIERDSVRNKRRYAKRWGYELEIVDMSTKKKYAHEWRESWEKVDTMRNCMRKYPKAEWFWWLDLNTFIMEPSISLQSQVFNELNKNVYRDINQYNPLNITHPPTSEFLDPISRSPSGDNKTSSIDLIVPQDCAGFNLGSFLLRRSAWTDRLLDIWWDPVLYEQKHMEWEHKEQDALEHMYNAQPWIRTHTAFIQQRKINSFPKGACGDDDKTYPDKRFHYSEADRDFLVNMAGCEWGRDCWGEMYNFRELSNKLNRSAWEKFKDGISERWKKIFKRKKS
ncbi:MAG: hypothetical protein GOMPHAMPRED_002641 [Gomphillus americanus]|uniref:Glycosyltransferase family 34 protein n=1 Tax=Gomphillus americanus TaxID=1940652 RepID=A0A8H3FB06_9LECA|nr:MAG: hypothetical protein GOMPHAMPRED_002641 [Gomphillus americanus]